MKRVLQAKNPLSRTGIGVERGIKGRTAELQNGGGWANRLRMLVSIARQSLYPKGRCKDADDARPYRPAALSTIVDGLARPMIKVGSILLGALVMGIELFSATYLFQFVQLSRSH